MERLVSCIFICLDTAANSEFFQREVRRRNLYCFSGMQANWVHMQGKHTLTRLEMQMNSFLKFIVGVLLLIIVAAAIYLLTYWSSIINVSNVDKVAPIITGLFTPLVATVTVLVSYLVINAQFKRNSELEKIKQRLGEVYKRESDAYFKTWAAFSTSYRLLSKLQSGSLGPDSKNIIEKAFSEAESNVFVLKDPDQDMFYKYWQNISELIAMADKTADGTPKRDLWETHGPQLGGLFNKMREDFRAQYLATQQ
jgi:hypothetical protein